MRDMSNAKKKSFSPLHADGSPFREDHRRSDVAVCSLQCKALAPTILEISNCCTCSASKNRTDFWECATTSFHTCTIDPCCTPPCPSSSPRKRALDVGRVSEATVSTTTAPVMLARREQLATKRDSAATALDSSQDAQVAHISRCTRKTCSVET